MTKIIGLVGFISAGKGTVSQYFVEKYDYIQESFAGSLKDATANIFGWDRTLLEGDTKESREYREQVDTWWSEKLGMPDFTPRLALQLMGTDVMRNNFHNDIWILSLQKRLLSTSRNIVVSDCRFQNEINSIKQLNGTIIRIKRGDEPEWYNDALNGIYPMDVHASEYGWIGGHIDYVIENDGTLEELYQKIDDIIGKI